MFDVFIMCLVGTLGVCAGLAIFSVVGVIGTLVASIVLNSIAWVIKR